MIKIFFSFTFLITFLVIVSVISSGCNQNKIIEEEKFIKIYTDLIIAKDTASPNSQSPDDIIKNVLAKHDAALEEYKMTVQYYNDDSERWEKFFTKAISYLEEKRRKSAK